MKIFGAQRFRPGRTRAIHDKTTRLRGPTVHSLTPSDNSADVLFPNLVTISMWGKVSLLQNSHSLARYNISNSGQDYRHLYRTLVVEFSARGGPIVRSHASDGTTISDSERLVFETDQA